VKGQGIRGDLNSAAVWAGISAFIWYAFGTIPLQISVADQLALPPAQASSWIFIVWFSGALSSIALSLVYRQPIPITWTIPGLVYLGTLAGQFPFPELLGANLVAGGLIVGLGLLGVGERVMAWLPLPIVMGMFAGSIFNYVTRLVRATVEDVMIAGATVAGYLLGRFLAHPRLPPLGLALGGGAIAMVLTDRLTPTEVVWALPTIVVPGISLSLPAVVAVSLPMVILAMGLGNVQGLGFLLAQGYAVPVRIVTVVVGLNSIVNAVFGGHPAIVARTGVAILAAADAGPPTGRYWANLIAASLTIGLALAATSVFSLLAILPGSYIVALAGLAILASFQDALERAFGTTLRFGALTALAIAATPFAVLGITSAAWAVVAGLLASLIVERQQLLAHWRKNELAAG
jgi:benzoate membrane transport protein